MLDIRRDEDHHHHSRSWLETRWHFSFGDYYDPDNVRFGALRVVNHDIIDGGGGFPEHSHDNMEILTWIIEGNLVHEDSTGTREAVGRNGIQKMSAGTGIAHSEFNGSETDPLELIQIWIEPDEQDVEPSYSDDEFNEETLMNNLVPVAGEGARSVPLRQDATVYVAMLEGGQTLNYDLGKGRRGYLVAMRGTVNLKNESLDTGDAVRITEEDRLSLQTDDTAEILFMDLP